MPRRVHWPCWHRPARRSVNQTLRPLPSWAPPALRGTRSRAVGHPCPAWSWASTAPPWRTSVASNPTAKAAQTVAETELPPTAPAAATKSGSGCPAIMLPPTEVPPLASSPIRPMLRRPAPGPAAAPHQDWLSSSRLTDRTSLLVGSPRRTARLPLEKLRMSRAALPAPTAITAIPKRTLMQSRPARTVPTLQTPATSGKAQTAVLAALMALLLMRGAKRSLPSRASALDASPPFLPTRQASLSSHCPPLTLATTDL